MRTVMTYIRRHIRRRKEREVVPIPFIPKMTRERAQEMANELLGKIKQRQEILEHAKSVKEWSEMNRDLIHHKKMLNVLVKKWNLDDPRIIEVLKKKEDSLSKGEWKLYS